MNRPTLALLCVVMAGGLSPACARSGAVAPPTVPVAELQPESPSESTAEREVEPAPTPDTPFGGTDYGFVECSSDNGRIVLLRRFPGGEVPQFGHHGSSSVPNELVVFDLVAGTERVIDDWISLSAGRRHVLVIDDGQLWLLDAEGGHWEALPGVDLENDGNRCIPPRAGEFSADGSRVAWVLAGSGALQVRDLETGAEWSVPSQGRLWRGWPKDAGRGAVLLETPPQSTDWPLQQTSCACRWCNRFALSYSTGGWVGPSFDIIAVADDGSRSPGAGSEESHAIRGETTAGCSLHAAERDGESLERGPWRWVCGANAP